MATQEMLIKHGTQLLFADHAGDFGAAPATAANSLIVGSPTDVQMDNGGVLSTAGRQSAKTVSLARTGSAWVEEWVLGACIEFSGSPTDGSVSFYWNPSPNETAGSGNSGGASGADAAFTVAPADQLTFIGPMPYRANTINIKGDIGILRMPYLYGSLIIINNTDANFAATADEMHITLTPLIPDAQAAA